MKNNLNKLGLLALLGIMVSCGGGTTSQNPSTSSNGDTSSTTTSNATTSSGTTTSSAGTTSETTTSESETITSIKDVIEAGFNGTAGTTQYTFQGTVVGIIQNSYYLQEGTSGIYVYNLPVSGLALGKKVKVSSQITNYNGLVETNYSAKDSAKVTLVGDGETYTAKTYTVETFNNEYQCTLANIEGLKYSSGSVTVGTSSNIEFKIGDNKVIMHTDKYLDDEVETAIKEKVESIKANDTVSFVNTVLYMNTRDNTNTIQVGITSADQIVITKGEAIKVTGITAKDSVEVNINGKVDLEASVLPENADDKELVYSVENPAICEVIDGQVKGLTAGNTNVTIKSHENETITKTVAVTVKNESQAVGEKLEITRATAFSGLTGTSYATYNGDHTIGAYTVKTTDVLGNTYGGELNVLQFKKSSGTLTVDGTFQKVTVVMYSTYDFSSTDLIYVDDTMQTINKETVNATKEDTGAKYTNNGKSFNIYKYTIELDLGAATTGTFKVTNKNSFALYIGSIVLE